MSKQNEGPLDEAWPKACPHCGALRNEVRKYCTECGRKISPDRQVEEPDCVTAMRGSLHSRLSRYLQLCEDVDNAEDINDQLFG
ncbi:MAG: hypothetical protein NTY53_21625 [Kiritimatiellaeota bacterium]|nr:hypothetical protein [Kiritimatiellota bacterium]